MNNVIEIKVENNYGNQCIYIVSDHYEAIKRLTGKKTISLTDIHSLKMLGFSFASSPSHLELIESILKGGKF